MKIVAVIPARGGSKGIPRKNLKPLNGKPLIAYVLQEALKSGMLDEVYVSTDDKQIAAVAEAYGAKVIMRPAEFATDTASSESVLLHFARKVKFDHLLFLQCTAPLTSVDDINGIIREYTKQRPDTMFSVCESDGGFHTSRFVWDEEANPIGHTLPRKRRQDLKTQYKENGAMYIMSRQGLLKYKDRFHGIKKVYIMPKERSYEIDGLPELEFLDKLLRCGLVR